MRFLFLILCTAPHLIHSQDSIIYDDTDRRVITKVPGVVGGNYVNGAFADSRFWQPQGGMLIAGSNVMVMADTENQVVRKVDWGSKTTSHIVGNATVTGNCLDGSCPANSFSDGTGTSVTLTMPYSVQMHRSVFSHPFSPLNLCQTLFISATLCSCLGTRCSVSYTHYSADRM